MLRQLLINAFLQAMEIGRWCSLQKALFWLKSFQSGHKIRRSISRGQLCPRSRQETKKTTVAANFHLHGETRPSGCSRWISPWLVLTNQLSQSWLWLVLVSMFGLGSKWVLLIIQISALLRAHVTVEETHSNTSFVPPLVVIKRCVWTVLVTTKKSNISYPSQDIFVFSLLRTCCIARRPVVHCILSGDYNTFHSFYFFIFICLLSPCVCIGVHRSTHVKSLEIINNNHRSVTSDHTAAVSLVKW
jgi:hypothetical protein